MTTDQPARMPPLPDMVIEPLVRAALAEDLALTATSPPAR